VNFGTLSSDTTEAISVEKLSAVPVVLSRFFHFSDVHISVMGAYTAVELLSFNRHTELAPPPRATRKALFRYQLWLPAAERRVRRVVALSPEKSYRSLFSGSTESRDIEPTTNDNTNNGGDVNKKRNRDDRKSAGNNKNLRLATLNARSLGNKFSAVSELISDREWDILTLTESWHRDSGDVPMLRSVPVGYRVINVPRRRSDRSEASSGGGIALYFRDHFRTKRVDVPTDHKSFESVCVSMSTVRGPVTIVVIYRPPGRPDANFYNEFTSYLEVVATFNSQLVIAGDLNIHFEQPTDPVTMRINQLLASFALVQRVDQPTHQCGGILDVIVTRSDCAISDMVIDPPSLSDHGPVSCTIPCACPASPIFTCRQVRGWKRLDSERFNADLLASSICREESWVDKSADQLFDLYANTLREILDRHAPFHDVKARVSTSTPWFDSECRAIKRNVRVSADEGSSRQNILDTINPRKTSRFQTS